MNYVRNIVIHKAHPTNDEIIMAYCPEEESIRIYQKGLYHYIKSTDLYEKTRFQKISDATLSSICHFLNLPFKNQTEKFLFQNALICQSLLHEMDHVLSTKRLQKGKKFPLEYQLIYDAFEPYLSLKKNLRDYENQKIAREKYLKNKLLYSNYTLKDLNNWGLSPNERHAEIRSYQQIYQIMQVEEKRYEDIANTLLYKLFEFEIRKYRTCIFSPTIQYYYNMEYFDKLKNLPFYYPDYAILTQKVFQLYPNFQDRILYGLPITCEEFNVQREEMKELKKKKESF